MNAHSATVYLPPPPPSPSSPSNLHGQRRPNQPVPPPPISTDVGTRYGSHLVPQTPASALPPSSVFSPFSPGHAPPSAMNTYNPQEWGRSASVAGQYVPHATAAAQVRQRGTRDVTGMEARLPEPPPPYSAAPSTNTNNNPAARSSFHPSPQNTQFVQSLTSSPVAHSPNANAVPSATPASARPMPLDSAIPASASQAAPSMSFPPPPGSQRDRSSSRTRGVLSNIAAFASSRTRTSDNASPANTPDTYSRQRGDSISRTPASSVRPVLNAFEYSGIPAGARRSASVGVVPPSQTPPSRDLSLDQSASNERVWEQGMPLPGPPPGPPPSSRSQSMNRVLDRSGNASPDPFAVVSPVPTRVARGSTLGPVPPTPADWVDEDIAPAKQPGAERTQLRIDTQNNEADEPQVAPVSLGVIQSAFEPNAGKLSHAATQARILQAEPRPEPMSIRDRRNGARARSKEPLTAIEAASVNPWSPGVDETKPANLVLSSSNNSGLGRRRHASKPSASPRSGHFSPGLSSAEGSGGASSFQGVRGSPQDLRSALSKPGGVSAPTPPFSPGFEARENATQHTRNFTAISSRALPTPPNRDSTELSSATTRTSRESPLRLDASPLGPGLASAPLSSAKSVDSRMSATPASATPNKFDGFARASLERFERFLESEVSSSEDQEKLELFAEFVVNESRLRRDRYSAAFENMGSDVLDLTRDLWRSYSTSKRPKPASSSSLALQTQGSTPRPPSRSETGTPAGPSSGSSPGSANFTPTTEPDSPGGATKYGRRQGSEGLQRQGSFQPMLSPIPSMAMSTVPDGSDSRGRAPSRWWEQSDEGSFGAGGRKIERSKRESKYMGLPREAREHLQWDNAEPSPAYSAGPSNQYQNLGPNEYPSEKVGWHDEGTPQLSAGFAQTPSTPQPRGLDVSRLITLPPPFPRHHPAVNNSHPELSAIRANLRAISDDTETASFFERYNSQYPEQSATVDSQSISDRRREMRSSIQSRVASGEMSFADAARAETTFEDSIVKEYRDTAQKNFDGFQSLVLKPLSSMLNEKISNATASIDSLRDDLLRAATPDQTQEEGDERPELLEKLTLMKWLFEARETLHKELFELQNKSDERYKHVILAPYRVSANEAKIAEVEEFFNRDSHDRTHRCNNKIVKRFESFLAPVEETVTRGVEAQLSAFWDIAPGLLAVVQKVPADESRLHTFDIQVPQRELVENPPYVDFPLQYLYTLLLHAEKSAYQFIESQTNLFCLLHEVKTGLMLAGARVLEAQRAPQPGESAEAVAKEMEAVRAGEDERLTRELKDKVDVVEEQWRSALGSALGDCKIRVGTFLVHVGGWDDSLEE